MRTAALAILGVLTLDVLLGGGLSATLDASSRSLWIKVLLPPLLAVPFTWWEYRQLRARSRRSIDDLASSLVAEWEDLAGPGWVGRTLRMGVRLGLGIGVPVGLLIALGSAGGDLATGSRLGSFLGFLGATFAWTLPVSFLLRGVAKRLHPLAEVTQNRASRVSSNSE